MKISGIKVSFRRLLAVALTVCFIAETTVYAKWSFGVHGDTQWSLNQDPSGKNPDHVSAAVVGALNEQFIAKGVKFVVQVGDLSDWAGDAAMYTRASASQPLYNKGIGFFPVRGNHEVTGYSKGLDPARNLNIPAYLNAFPQTQGTANTFGAYNFSSPDITALKGLSYSFDYGTNGDNARFVIVDVQKASSLIPAPYIAPYGQGYFYYNPVYQDLNNQNYVVYKHSSAVYDKNNKEIQPGTWFRIDSQSKPSTNFSGMEVKYPIDDNIVLEKYNPVATEFWPGMQQDWISGQLDKTTRGTEHAFVFSHQPLMGANHVDCFFGSNPGSKETTQNPFYASLMNNNVKYMMSGHDHIYNRAMVKSPDGLSQVEQLISIGASTKFYSPAPLSKFNTTYGDVKKRETQISQEINNIGYYIYTVDGPRVTVDYYSDAIGNFKGDNGYPDGSGSLLVPAFNFVKKETWGYSLNGKNFLVAQGQPYSAVSDVFEGTTAKILSGDNQCTAVDFVNLRPFTKSINTGWGGEKADRLFRSEILTLWGMSDFGTPDETDLYTLSLSYDQSAIGACALMSQKNDGSWTHAVDLNKTADRKFVAGPHKSTYGIGTYGIDHATKTVWAVIGHAGIFAVRASSDGDQDNDGDVDNDDVGIVVSFRNQPASACSGADLDNDGKITVLDARKAVLLKTVN